MDLYTWAISRIQRLRWLYYGQVVWAWDGSTLTITLLERLQRQMEAEWAYEGEDTDYDEVV